MTMRSRGLPGFSIVAGGWLLAAVIAVLVAPRTARKLGTALSSMTPGGRPPVDPPAV